ncbi:hypothetical protein [Halomonas sp. 3A7M]|uniref:hypothetical protein n=1 Tax=Halomonas sp. 3A7M TaxID=2742616 RepID=UPI001868AF30|nr:hypothetical protein [Halomonas sp. 3A7M]
MTYGYDDANQDGICLSPIPLEARQSPTLLDGYIAGLESRYTMLEQAMNDTAGILDADDVAAIEQLAMDLDECEKLLSSARTVLESLKS